MLFRSDAKLPDLSLYEFIIFLKHFCKDKAWVVENVIPYYDVLIKPTVTLQRHNFWSNFKISPKGFSGCNVAKTTKEVLAEYHKIPLPKCKDQRKLLRNCVNPEVGKHIIIEYLLQFYDNNVLNDDKENDVLNILESLGFDIREI